MIQKITRICTFDSGHRVMNEQMKCFNIHGHTYICHLEFEFQSIEEIGYAIDFKEIKRVGCQWIDDYLDHGMILNPKDEIVIKATQDVKGKIWLISLNKEEYCNPSVENIAKEIFLAMMVLFESYKETLKISKITLYETPNCYTSCTKDSIFPQEAQNWMITNYEKVSKYQKDKGIVNYDDRK